MKKIVTMMIAAAMVFSTAGIAFAQEADAAVKNVSLSKAKAIALKDAKLKTSQVRIQKAKLDREDGVYEIDFVKKSNRAEYDYELSLKGKILEKSADYRYTRSYSKKQIGKAKARSKVAAFSKFKLSVVKNGTCKYERDDGEGFYEVKFRKGNYVYEYDVQAPTGKVVGWERKTVR